MPYDQHPLINKSPRLGFESGSSLSLEVDEKNNAQELFWLVIMMQLASEEPIDDEPISPRGSWVWSARMRVVSVGPSVRPLLVF